MERIQKGAAIGRTVHIHFISPEMAANDASNDWFDIDFAKSMCS